MDFSHLHTYAPPQCVPENTGYTYALSSSYSSTALDFEVDHNLEPVFDSPRMSRRSLRLSATAHGRADDVHSESIFSSSSSSARKKASADQSLKIVKQCKSSSKQPGSLRHTPRKNVPSSSVFSHSSFSSQASNMSFMSSILDESSIREQTSVDHFWGLDEDGDLKGGECTTIQGNGDIAAAENQTSLSNGYTCNDCSMLSERKEVLTAYAASHLPPSIIYSRDRSQKHKSRGLPFYTSKILQVAKYTSASFASLLVQLFQMVLLKLGYNFKAHSNYYGTMNVQEFLREDGHVGRNGGYICYFLLHMFQRMGTAGWFVSKTVLSLLRLAVVSPGKAAAGVFWWLGTGWYQLATLISLVNVFLLTRCLPKIFRLLLFLLPLLLLLGLWHWGSEGFLSLLPAFTWTRIRSWDDSAKVPKPQHDSFHALRQSDETIQFFDSGRMSELEKQMAFMSEKWHDRDEEHGKMLLMLLNIRDQVTQMNDRSEMLIVIKKVVDQHLAEMRAHEAAAHAATDLGTSHQEHEWRIVALEELLAKLSARSEDLQNELELTKAKAVSETDEQSQQLLSKIKHLEFELAQIKSELLSYQDVKTCCDKMGTFQGQVDAQVKESVKFLLFGDQPGELPESLLQWLSSRFVSKNDLQVLLQDLERRILHNISLHTSITNSKPSLEVVTSVVNEAGISGITEAQAHRIVNNALKLYSQDKTGMVDFALESGGGSILSTRCSETYETKTALISLFGIPLWYFSQSPRVVIQPDMYPGNCWAFKGSQGYLVVRLSMMIYPTAFTLEHIPKTLSPTGNVSSAPKDFSVYGLDNEYQEEGIYLGQYMYDQDGESLQMFQVTETTEKPFQIVELRILSNWGHTEYTCLYRLRVHGRPAE